MNLNDLNRKLRAVIDGISEKVNTTKIGEVAKELIVNRTSRGFGVNDSGGREGKLKPLKASYKKQRRRLRKQGRLSGETAPDKSNLTQTRQMLNSVNSRGETGKAVVFLDNAGANEKASLQEQAGRKFMNLSKGELDKIAKLIETQIANDIKKKGL